MLLRRAKADDEPFLRQALYLAIHVPPGRQPPPPDVIDEPELSRYVDGWGRPGDLGVIAELDGRPVGAAWLRLWSAEDYGYGFVDPATPELSMAVTPGHRGRGIGSRLLDRLLDAASGLYPAVSLSVSTTNPARRLYERFGFRTIERASDSITMRLRFDRIDAPPAQ